MNANDKQLRAVLAQQATEWFVLNDADSLSPRQANELVAWLTRSPEHVAEFLAVAQMARDLRAVRLDDASLQALVDRARADEGEPVHRLGFRPDDFESRAPPWRGLASAAAAVSALVAGLFFWHTRPPTTPQGPAVTEARLYTGHEEQRTWQLADQSLVRLNSDTVVTIHYTANGRFVRLEAGQAAFEVTHDAQRVFHVVAGAAEITDLGTSFDVRLAGQSTVVTVIEGRVEVQPVATADVSASAPRIGVRLGANQQVNVTIGQPLSPASVQADHETAWMRRQVEFDHEPLERVAAEINRYAAKPVVITTAELRTLPVSGTFSIDDSEELIAFLRSLEGVHVEVTARDIRVSKK